MLQNRGIVIIYYSVSSMSTVLCYKFVLQVIFVDTVQKTYKVFADLLAQKGVTPYRVYKETGVPQSSLSEWKRGNSMPKIDKIQRLAEYFGVTVDYLLTGESSGKNGTPILTKKDERDISKRLDQTLCDLENSQGALMFDGEPLDDVTKELLISSLRKDLEMGKRIAKQKYTPKKYRKPE